MIHILVRLQVLNFDALELFEQQACVIMKRYGGSIVSAFEISRDEKDSGEEVHILQFPDEQAFGQYRLDKALLKLSSLRDEAILNTEINVSIKGKTYG